MLDVEQTPKSWNVGVGWFILFSFSCLVWRWRTAMFQLPGFHWRADSQQKAAQNSKTLYPSLPDENCGLMATSSFCPRVPQLHYPRSARMQVTASVRSFCRGPFLVVSTPDLCFWRSRLDIARQYLQCRCPCVRTPARRRSHRWMRRSFLESKLLPAWGNSMLQQ